MRARRGTCLLWANLVLPAHAACRLERGRFGFGARARRAARHPWYGRSGYCPRAPPAALRPADLVFARARRTPSDILVMREPGIARADTLAALRWPDLVFGARATSLLWANSVLPARAACRVERGGSGFRASALRPGYGRTVYCPRAPRAALRRADLVLARACRVTFLLCENRVLLVRAASCLEMGGSCSCARAPHAAWRRPCYGRSGYCLRAPPSTLRRADLVFARARSVTSLFWAKRVLPARAAYRLETGRSSFCARAPRGINFIGEPGIARAGGPFALRRADLVVGCAHRVARDTLVMGEPGIACARRLPP